MSHEDQRSIVEWAKATFGEPAEWAVWDKLEEELGEMNQARYEGNPFDCAKEAADVYIVLVQYVSALGYDLHELVDAKMQVNRKRKWKLTGQGTAQHVEEGEG